MVTNNSEENVYKNMSKDDIKDKLQQEGITIHNEQERETVLNSLGILTARQRAVIGFSLFFAILGLVIVILFSLIYILCTKSDVLMPIICQELKEFFKLENVVTIILGISFLTFFLKSYSDNCIVILRI